MNVQLEKRGGRVDYTEDFLSECLDGFSDVFRAEENNAIQTPLITAQNSMSAVLCSGGDFLAFVAHSLSLAAYASPKIRSVECSLHESLPEIIKPVASRPQ